MIKKYITITITITMSSASQVNKDKNIKLLNDPNSDLYKKGLERTNSIDIDSYVEKDIQVFTNKTEIFGPKKDIIEHLNTGQAQNQYRTVCKKMTSEKCDTCNIKKSKGKYLERAHCNKDNCDRIALLEQAVNKFYIDDKTPILISDIIKEYLLLHKNKPIFMLCKKCHTQYDKKEKKKTNEEETKVINNKEETKVINNKEETKVINNKEEETINNANETRIIIEYNYYTGKELKNKTKTELKKLCADMNIKYNSNKNKTVERILENQ